MVADLAVVDRHRARRAPGATKNWVEKRFGASGGGVQCANGTSESAVDREPGLLRGLAHRGVAAGGGEIRVGEPRSAGKSPGSTRPPGNTHIPPANASRESRRSISVSSPAGASRSRIDGRGGDDRRRLGALRARAPSARTAPARSARRRLVHGPTLPGRETSRDPHAPRTENAAGLGGLGSRAMTDAAVVAVRGLTKRYGQRPGGRRPRLRGRAGPGVRAARPERRGQDHRAAHARRPDPADRGRGAAVRPAGAARARRSWRGSAR